MIVSFFIPKTQPPLAIDTDISIPVSAVFFCRPPGHSLKWVLRCSVFSKTFKTCWFPLYFIYRHFSRIALAIIWCRFFQHSLIKVSGTKHKTEDWVLRTEVYWNRKRRKWLCQLMTETDNSWRRTIMAESDIPWWNGRAPSRFFAQSSVLSTHYLFLIDTPLPFTYYPFIKSYPNWSYFAK